MSKTDVWVYAHWKGMAAPRLIGILSAHQAKGTKVFSFAYDPDWLDSGERFLLDPEINWYSGDQYPVEKENFGVFMDSMPDTWGKRLMQRKAAQRAAEEKKAVRSLTDLDYLLQVHDFTRMGALRFKTDPEGPFLDDDGDRPTPPWAHIRELQNSAAVFEEDGNETKEWLELLLAPGSSLGGARPKANILDERGNLWIAKFPAKNDTVNKAAWEYLTHLLAVDAGIEMAECKIEKVAGPYCTFFTKRFDRAGKERIHFSSAMTMTGQSEALIRDDNPSYLEIAEFIQYNSCAITDDLHQLWRRIVFNMSVSNTDDHLRNHGFILTSAGWRLSPAYDLNPSTDKAGLGLNVDLHNNARDYDLAYSVGAYFQLNKRQMDQILMEVTRAVTGWEKIAANLGITRTERELMAPAFLI